MSNSDKLGGNGSEPGIAHHQLDTLVLTYDRVNDHLDVGGKCNSLDLMLDMLARATRTLEAQLRAQNALALQQQLRQAAADAAVADAVRRGR